uniref:Set domain containing protein with a cysteine cluster at the c-terminus n=1 Tax=Tetraselmis sp. GSL018 TaxID=582737 RepID=A0A061RAT9_9CHLO|mmetsp:Transcript_31317/g.74431  ORF Transcript_31317/g.74431 Transcript_31317/m.74431 type:complete len:417 (-) Transcript_31317:509-1759(-)
MGATDCKVLYLDDTAEEEPTHKFFHGTILQLEKAPGRGRFLAAKKDIPSGELVLRCPAYAAAVFSSHKKRICRYCLAVSQKRSHSLTCSECGQVFWCSDACRQQHLGCDASSAESRFEATGRTTAPHSLVCGFLKSIRSCKFDTELESVLAVLADIAARALLGRTGSAPVPDLAGGLQPIEDFLLLEGHLEEILRDPSERQVWSKGARMLLEHFQAMEGGGEMIRDLGLTPTRLIDWGSKVLCNNFALNYEPARESEQGALGDPSDSPECDRETDGPTRLADDIANCVELGADSALGAPKRSRGGSLCCGRVVFVAASFFNHSCSPNCIAHTGIDEVEVRANRDIRAGEELNISYIDEDLPRSERQRLLSRFFFTCRCSRCEEEAISGSKKYTYLRSCSVRNTKPKRHGRKARTSR